MHLIYDNFSNIYGLILAFFTEIFTDVLLTFYILPFTKFFSELFFYRENVQILQGLIYTYKMSVNFGQNLQGKSKDFTDILCDLKAQNVVKFTEILYGL